jgi:hypothetical protein
MKEKVQEVFDYGLNKTPRRILNTILYVALASQIGIVTLAAKYVHNDYVGKLDDVKLRIEELERQSRCHEVSHYRDDADYPGCE